MRILASLIVLLAPIAIYFAIIRPRLKARFSDTYTHIDDFWERQWARLKAFRTLALTMIATWIAVLPNLLEAVSGMDFSFLPQPWPLIVGTGLSSVLAINRAMSTTAHNEPTP